MTAIILFYLSLILVLLIAVIVDPNKRFYVPLKMLCSLAFIFTFAYRRHVAPHSGEAYLATWIALAFCFLGDFFMGIYNKLRKKRFMVAGILTFMSAHVAFLVRLYSEDSHFALIDCILPIVCAFLLLFLTQLFHLHLGKLRTPAAIYSLFVSAFSVKAIHIFLTAPQLSPTRLVGTAGLLFWLSDFSLVFLYFFHYRKKGSQKATHLFNLITYYAAILLLVL